MFFPSEHPSPEFQRLKKVLAGEEKAKRVPFVECDLEDEMMDLLSSKIMGKKVPYTEVEKIKQKKISRFLQGHQVVLLTDEEEKIYLQRYIEFFFKMGYDYVPDIRPFYFLMAMIKPKVRIAKDTATVAPRKGGREWAEEGKGVITSWEDFERFPWERMEIQMEEYYKFLSKNLPEGMKTMTCGSIFEQLLERLLGFEGLFYLLHDQPDLVKAVANRWGEIMYSFYKDIITLDIVGGIWHTDDLGYKTATMLSPDILRKLIFPWFKKYASLAHRYGKIFWLHSCGNPLGVMEDLIEDVRIDAFHAFQDVIIPVGEFKKKYGNRIAVLGGVDVDKLCRLEEESLREYVRGILDECMPGGRFALGSGNGIPNYVPWKNYLIMLEEGLRWKSN